MMRLLGNSYLLGLLALIVGGAINYALGNTTIAGVVLAYIAGYLYSRYHKVLMSRAEKLKMLLVYLVLSIVIALVPVYFFAEPGNLSLPVFFPIVLALAAIEGLFMYVLLSFGSSQYMKTVKKDSRSPDSLTTEQTQRPGEEEKRPPSSRIEKFKERYPKVAAGFGFFTCGLIFIGFLFVAQDPLTTNDERTYVLISMGALGVLLVGALWVMPRYRVLATLGTVLVVAGAQFLIHEHLRAAPEEGAEAMMVSMQETALTCVEKNTDLTTRFGRDASFGRTEEPDPGRVLCYHQNTWEFLPTGWGYLPITDKQVSDGTFEFSIHNRRGDTITCTERGCDYRHSSGEITVLSTTKRLSASFALPESGSVRAGERVEVAQLTLTNPFDEPIDLLAFWYRKSGTASDSAIEMVYVQENDRTYGTNHVHSLTSPYYSKDGMVVIEQPDMFLLGPGQSRTYRIGIELSGAARAEVGKTIGLDFVGFSYDSKVYGVPVAGALFTIVQ